MAEEPDNLVLKMLREMREILDDHTHRFEAHDRHFNELKKMIEDWQETTSTGVGFAAHANIRTQALEKEIADLKHRLDRLERSH
jgi:hypothetical protein